MKRNSVKLKRKESDEWLCSSTYQPNRQEIIQKSQETPRPKPKKKLNIVVPRPKKSIKFENFEKNRYSKSTPNLNFTIDDDADDVDILNFVSTSEAVRTPTSGMARVKIISPAIPKVSSRKSLTPPVVPQIRQSPEQLFAALTPKRRPSFEVAEYVTAAKRRKEDSEEIQNPEDVTTESGRISPGEISEIQNPESGDSDVSNIFDTMSPVKLPPDESPEKSGAQTTNYKFSLDFITGFEAQFSRFEDTQPVEDVETSESSQKAINELEEDPMSIFEEESEEKCPEIKVFEEKTVRFVEPSSAWRKENLIEESCGAHLLNTSVFREYAIDVETCGGMAESSALPAPDEETQKYLAAESCALLAHTPLSDSQDEEIYERDELFGLSARFASLMSSKTSERRLLMSDVVFGTVPKEKLRKLDVSSHKSAFGMSIISTRTTPQTIIIRSSAIRRLPPSPSVPSLLFSTPPPFVCDPAPFPPLASPSPSSLAPISTIYSIGALSSSTSASEVLINPALVSEGAL